MTKERRVAIEMWEYIRGQYSSEYVDMEDYVYNLKGGYLWAHGNPRWAFHCWFCQYIGKRNRPGKRLNFDGCAKCPLKDCDHGPYGRLIRATNREEWEEACDEIIVALGGKV